MIVIDEPYIEPTKAQKRWFNRVLKPLFKKLAKKNGIEISISSITFKMSPLHSIITKDDKDVKRMAIKQMKKMLYGESRSKGENG